MESQVARGALKSAKICPGCGRGIILCFTSISNIIAFTTRVCKLHFLGEALTFSRVKKSCHTCFKKMTNCGKCFVTDVFNEIRDKLGVFLCIFDNKIHQSN